MVVLLTPPMPHIPIMRTSFSDSIFKRRLSFTMCAEMNSSSSSATPKFDVFLSCAEDTRKGMVSHLHQNRISPSLLEHLSGTMSSRDSFDDIKPSLVNRNILLVVDGVRDSEQLKDIVKISHWLSPGSRVIMTSKDKSSLVSCGVKYVYEMGCLRYDEALHIFSQFAFKQDYPRIGFEQLTVRTVNLAGHLPLALKLLGSILYGKEEESWKSTLHKLDASQDNGTREVCSYVAACEYLPIHQMKLERYIVTAEGEYSPSLSNVTLTIRMGGSCPKPTHIYGRWPSK